MFTGKSWWIRFRWQSVRCVYVRVSSSQVWQSSCCRSPYPRAAESSTSSPTILASWSSRTEATQSLAKTSVYRLTRLGWLNSPWITSVIKLVHCSHRPVIPSRLVSVVVCSGLEYTQFDIGTVQAIISFLVHKRYKIASKTNFCKFRLLEFVFLVKIFNLMFNTTTKV